MKGRVQTVRIALHQSDSALHVLQYPSGWHLCYNHSLRQFPFSLRRSRPHKRRYLWKSRLYLNSKTYKILTKWYHDITKPSSTFQNKTKKMSKCHTKNHSSRQNVCISLWGEGGHEVLGLFGQMPSALAPKGTGLSLKMPAAFPKVNRRMRCRESKK